MFREDWIKDSEAKLTIRTGPHRHHDKQLAALRKVSLLFHHCATSYIPLCISTSQHHNIPTTSNTHQHPLPRPLQLPRATQHRHERARRANRRRPRQTHRPRFNGPAPQHHHRHVGHEHLGPRPGRRGQFELVLGHVCVFCAFCACDFRYCEEGLSFGLKEFFCASESARLGWMRGWVRGRADGGVRVGCVRHAAESRVCDYSAWCISCWAWFPKHRRCDLHFNWDWGQVNNYCTV